MTPDPTDATFVTPQDLTQTAERIARQLLDLTEAQKDSELRAIKTKNPILHAMVAQKLGSVRRKFAGAEGMPPDPRNLSGTKYDTRAVPEAYPDDHPLAGRQIDLDQTVPQHLVRVDATHCHCRCRRDRATGRLVCTCKPLVGWMSRALLPLLFPRSGHAEEVVLVAANPSGEEE